MDRLTALLNNVDDSYYDFVVGVLNYAKRKSSNREAITSFIENNPKALTSDILEYMLSRDDYYDHAECVVGVASSLQEQV